ncbi:MAG: hypothetical protein GY796_30945 [Chloroflexi bacterium]|nr:hypothetical protein [Chloroflexota bacterium]
MKLEFDQFEIAAITAASFITVFVSLDGKSNWLEGSILLDDEFIRDFAPAVGREHIHLEGGEHILRIEASGRQHAKQEIPFQVEGDMEIVIKRKMTTVKPHFYLD